MKQREEIGQFWSWFGSVAPLLAEAAENPELLRQLDARVHALDASLSWEIGPGWHEPWQLVISPNLDRWLWPRTQEIISCAPVIDGWEFHSTRRRKEWDYKFRMERSGGQAAVELDASRWEFVLLRYPDGAQEILLQGRGLADLEEDEKWQAAAIALESILGEDVLLDKIDWFELVDELEPRFADKCKPIQYLRDALRP